MGICDPRKRASAVAVLLLSGLFLEIFYVYSSWDTSKVPERVRGSDDSVRFEATRAQEQPTNTTKRTTQQKRKMFTPKPLKPTAPTTMDLENIDRKRALVLGYRKVNKGYLTIGITTAKRKNASYLKLTLQSLIDNANEQERDQLRIVVLACDFEAESRKEAYQIVAGFPEHIQSGLLQLIEAPKSFYLPLTGLKRTFNDADVRVHWRSKEIQDVVFLFAYSVGMSDHYMMFDDDLTTSPRYIQAIRNFVETHQTDHWFMLDICELGTGKLFRDNDLLRLGRTLVEFYQEQPVDLLLFNLMNVWNQRRHFVLKPPLFKHLGQVSTLSLKTKHLGINYT